ncbi:MAG TPA: polysaccharide deacetylase family protein [Candidatus Cloacimonadota bacterium]|nr:polysaccharide deacetylase family protein [Candidatus Cloacimonadota bacterium]
MTASIALSFDIEQITNSNLSRVRISGSDNAIVREIDFILELCEEFQVKATFFVLAELLKKCENAIHKIASNGHEICSHSISHRLLYNLSVTELRNEIIDSKKMLEDALGVQVYGFRAPSWSVSQNMQNLYYDLLSEAGYKYSSSIFPGKNFLYGIMNADSNVNQTSNGIIEFPVPVLIAGKHKLGFSGGAYFRFFPLYLTQKGIQKYLNNGRQIFLYYHPWEFPIEEYRIEGSFYEKILLGFGRKYLTNKVRKVLNIYKGEVKTMQQVLNIF